MTADEQLKGAEEELAQLLERQRTLPTDNPGLEDRIEDAKLVMEERKATKNAARENSLL